MRTRNDGNSSAEVVVYLAEFPDRGLEHRIFDDDEILISGGIHAIEAELERGTDRFVRIGVVDDGLPHVLEGYEHPKDTRNDDFLVGGGVHNLVLSVLRKDRLGGAVGG